MNQQQQQAERNRVRIRSTLACMVALMGAASCVTTTLPYETPADDDSSNSGVTGGSAASVGNGGTAQGPTSTQWVQTYGAPASTAFATSLDVSEEGSIAVAAHFRGQIDFGSGVRVSGAAADVALMRLDHTGHVEFERVFGDDALQTVNDVVITPTGGVAFTGQTRGTMSGLGSSPPSGDEAGDMYLAVLDRLGDTVDARAFAGPEDQTGWRLRADAEGYVVAATFKYQLGNIDCNFDFPGDCGLAMRVDHTLDNVTGPRWLSAGLSINGLIVNDDQVRVLGTFDKFMAPCSMGPPCVAAPTGSDLFATDFDASLGPGQTTIYGIHGGGTEQVIAAEGSDDDGAFVVAANTVGDSIVFGGSVVQGDFLTVVEAEGELAWTRDLPDTTPGVGAVAFDAQGGIVVVGASRNVINFGDGPGTGTYVVRYSADGEFSSSRFYTGVVDVRDAEVDVDDHLVIVGGFDDAFDFGTGIHIPRGAKDMVIARLAL